MRLHGLKIEETISYEQRAAIPTQISVRLRPYQIAGATFLIENGGATRVVAVDLHADKAF